MIGLKIWRQFINQWNGKPKPRTIFPALWASYVELLRIWIGSLRCFHLVRLVEVITLVFVLRYSIENRSNNNNNNNNNNDDDDDNDDDHDGDDVMMITILIISFK